MLHVVATADNGTGMTESKTIKIIPQVKVTEITVNAATGGSNNQLLMELYK